MAHVKMKQRDATQTSLNIGQNVYRPDASGHYAIEPEHVEIAKSHGLTVAPADAGTATAPKPPKKTVIQVARITEPDDDDVPFDQVLAGKKRRK